MKDLRLIAVPLLLALGLSSAAAQRPTDGIKRTADRIIFLLNDAHLKGPAKQQERHRLIRQELDQRFDWAGIARSCLGRHWAKRSRAEQTEFVALFSDFLERTYVEKFETYYTDLDKIDYVGEKTIDAYASVKSVITTKEGVEHPVEYRLQKPAGVQGWRIYDVLIEGVSLVKNYRDQFDEIIARDSYAKLVSDLKSKLRTD